MDQEERTGLDVSHNSAGNESASNKEHNNPAGAKPPEPLELSQQDVSLSSIQESTVLHHEEARAPIMAVRSSPSRRTPLSDNHPSPLLTHDIQDGHMGHFVSPLLGREVGFDMPRLPSMWSDTDTSTGDSGRLNPLQQRKRSLSDSDIPALVATALAFQEEGPDELSLQTSFANGPVHVQQPDNDDNDDANLAHPSASAAIDTDDSELEGVEDSTGSALGRTRPVVAARHERRAPEEDASSPRAYAVTSSTHAPSLGNGDKEEEAGRAQESMGGGGHGGVGAWPHRTVELGDTERVKPTTPGASAEVEEVYEMYQTRALHLQRSMETLEKNFEEAVLEPGDGTMRTSVHGARTEAPASFGGAVGAAVENQGATEWVGSGQSHSAHMEDGSMGDPEKVRLVKQVQELQLQVEGLEQDKLALHAELSARDKSEKELRREKQQLVESEKKLTGDMRQLLHDMRDLSLQVASLTNMAQELVTENKALMDSFEPNADTQAFVPPGTPSLSEVNKAQEQSHSSGSVHLSSSNHLSASPGTLSLSALGQTPKTQPGRKGAGRKQHDVEHERGDGVKTQVSHQETEPPVQSNTLTAEEEMEVLTRPSVNWAAEDDKKLNMLVKRMGADKWDMVSSVMGLFSAKDCQQRHQQINPDLSIGTPVKPPGDPKGTGGGNKTGISVREHQGTPRLVKRTGNAKAQEEQEEREAPASSLLPIPLVAGFQIPLIASSQPLPALSHPLPVPAQSQDQADAAAGGPARPHAKHEVAWSVRAPEAEKTELVDARLEMQRMAREREGADAELSAAREELKRMGEQLGRMHWLEQNLQDRELDLTELKGKLQDAELELHRKAEVDVSKLLDAEREGLEMRGEREDRTRSLEQTLQERELELIALSGKLKDAEHALLQKSDHVKELSRKLQAETESVGKLKKSEQELARKSQEASKRLLQLQSEAQSVSGTVKQSARASTALHTPPALVPRTPELAGVLSPRAEFVARQEDFARSLMLRVEELEVELEDAHVRELELQAKESALMQSQSEQHDVICRSLPQIRMLCDGLRQAALQAQDVKVEVEVAEKTKEREREELIKAQEQLERLVEERERQRECEREEEHKRERVREEEKDAEREKETARIKEREEWRMQDEERERERERQWERERETMRQSFDQQELERQQEWEKQKSRLTEDLKMKEHELREGSELAQELHQLRSEMQDVEMQRERERKELQAEGQRLEDECLQLKTDLLEVQAARDEVEVRHQQLLRETQALQMDKRELLLKMKHLSADLERSQLDNVALEQSRKELGLKIHGMTQAQEEARLREDAMTHARDLASEASLRRERERENERVAAQERERAREAAREEDRTKMESMAKEKEEYMERAARALGKAQARVVALEEECEALEQHVLVLKKELKGEQRERALLTTVNAELWDRASQLTVLQQALSRLSRRLFLQGAELGIGSPTPDADTKPRQESLAHAFLVSVDDGEATLISNQQATAHERKHGGGTEGDRGVGEQAKAASAPDEASTGAPTAPASSTASGSETNPQAAAEEEHAEEGKNASESLVISTAPDQTGGGWRGLRDTQSILLESDLVLAPVAGQVGAADVRAQAGMVSTVREIGADCVAVVAHIDSRVNALCHAHSSQVLQRAWDMYACVCT